MSESRNIENKKIAEEAMKLEETKYIQLLKNITSIAIHGYTPEGKTIFWNKASENLYGFTHDEAIGKSIFELIIPREMQHYAEEEIRKMLNSGEPIVPSEFSFKRKEGSRVSVYSSHFVFKQRSKISEIYRIDVELSEQKKTERELIKIQNKLKETLRTLKLVLEHLPLRVYVKDLDLNYIYCNTLFANDAGFDFDHEITGKSDYDLSWSERADLIQSSDLDVINTEMPMAGTEEELTKASGETIWIKSTKIPLQDDDDSVIGVLGIYEDITLQKMENIRREESLSKFRNLSQATSDMFFLPNLLSIYDYILNTLSQHFPDSIISLSTFDEAECSAKIIDIRGIDKLVQQKVGTISNLFSIGETQVLGTEYLQLLESGKFTELKQGLTEYTKNKVPVITAKTIEKLLRIGRVYSIGINASNNLLATVSFFTPSKLSASESEYIQSLVEQAAHVIENKISELANKSYIEELEAITNNSAVWECWFGIDGNLKWVNPTVEMMTGYTPDEIYEFPDFFETLFDKADLDRVYNDIAQAIIDDETHGENFEYNCIRKNGTIFPLLLDWQKVYNENGRFMGIKTSAKDVSQLKKRELVAEQEIQELKQSNITKDNLISIIGHDLKNPLTGIVGFSEMLGEEYLTISREQIKEYQTIIHRQSKSMFDLLENLLMWSRAQSGKIKVQPIEIDIRKMTESCFELLETAAVNKKISLVNNVPKTIRAYADSMMVLTVIRNLISNAIKFTPVGGRINVEGAVQVGNVIVSISDNGVGISPDKIEKVFENSQMTSSIGTLGEKGTGLGLYICKEFVEINDGRIWIESERNVGTTVFFTLPEKPAKKR